jgi:hypothetical protein
MEINSQKIHNIAENIQDLIKEYKEKIKENEKVNFPLFSLKK